MIGRKRAIVLGSVCCKSKWGVVDITKEGRSALYGSGMSLSSTVFLQRDSVTFAGFCPINPEDQADVDLG